MYRLDFTGKWLQDNPERYSKPLWSKAGIIPWTNHTLDTLLGLSPDEFVNDLSIFLAIFPSQEAAQTALQKIRPNQQGIYPEVFIINQQTKEVSLRQCLIEAVCLTS